MEYKEVRALMERWLAGGTTLAEEAALRKFFADAEDGLPDDLRPGRALFGQGACAAAARSPRKLILHTGPEPGAGETPLPARSRRLTRWSVIAASIAAAIVGVVVFINPPISQSGEEIVCTVNGVKITDPAAIELYTTRALKMVNDNLQKPAAAVESELTGNPALTRAAKVMKSITIEIEN
jgi:hypothetical protein